MYSNKKYILSIIFSLIRSDQLRHLIMMSLSAVGMLAETYIRQLPKSQVFSAIGAIALCGSYYFTLLFLIFAASV